MMVIFSQRSRLRLDHLGRRDISSSVLSTYVVLEAYEKILRPVAETAATPRFENVHPNFHRKISLEW
jgi:hypothetical protein